MKILTDFLALGGVGAISYGCYLNYGAGNALMLGGGISLITALLFAWRGS